MTQYFMSDMCMDCRTKFLQGLQIEIYEYYIDLDRERIIYVCKHLNPYKKC